MKLTKKRKQQIRRWLVLALAAGVILLFVLSLLFTVFRFVYHRYVKPESSLDFTMITVTAPRIEEQILTPNKNSRPEIVLEEVKGVVVHYTANPGTDAEANRNYFESRKDEADAAENKVSSHFIIGLDGHIIQCIPLDEVAYASNSRNKDTISIECCHPDKKGKFTKKTYDSLIRLLAWLCDTYELEEDQIIRHYDVTGKECPLYYVKHPDAWETLRKDVRTSLLEGMDDQKAIQRN